MSLNKSSDYLQEIIDNDNLVSEIKDTKLNKYLKKLSSKIEKQKGVYTVLICLCLYKIKKPEQDIRYHKTKLKNGFSCRTSDTKYVTPVLKRNKLPSMSESGYLTRSLEQLAPYNLNYPGQIADTDARESFLHIINPGYKFQHDIAGEKRFGMVKNRYLEFKEEEIYRQDDEPSYYIYKVKTKFIIWQSYESEALPRK